jgi:hypothetical protein
MRPFSSQVPTSPRAHRRGIGIAALLLTGWPVIASAQRGEAPALHPVAPRSQLDGFPGTFNGALLEPGHWTLEVLPFPSVYYGLHQTATVRLGLVQFGAFANGYGFSGELRYRLWWRHRTSLVASFSGSFAHLGTKIHTGDEVDPSTGESEALYATSNDLRTVQITLTAEHRWTARSATALTAIAGGITFASERPFKMSAAVIGEGGTLAGAGLMLSHVYFPATWFGLDAGIGVAPYLDATLASPSGNAGIDLSRFGNSRGGLCGRFNIHLRTTHWLASLGALMLPPNIPVPVIGVSRTW